MATPSRGCKTAAAGSFECVNLRHRGKDIPENLPERGKVTHGACIRGVVLIRTNPTTPTCARGLHSPVPLISAELDTYLVAQIRNPRKCAALARGLHSPVKENFPQPRQRHSRKFAGMCAAIHAPKIVRRCEPIRGDEQVASIYKYH